MRAPKYIESNLNTLILREKNYLQHQLNLQKVKSNSSLSRNVTLPQVAYLTKINENKFRTKQKYELMKQTELNKKNEKILIKMIQIQNRTSQKKGIINSNISLLLELNQSRMNSARSDKSLNISFRKQTEQRIYKDNQRLMGKLLKAQTSIPISTQGDYTRHESLKSRVSKMSRQNQSRIRSVFSRLNISNPNHSFSLVNQPVSSKRVQNISDQSKINNSASKISYLQSPQSLTGLNSFKPLKRGQPKQQDSVSLLAANLARLRIKGDGSMQKLSLPQIKQK